MTSKDVTPQSLRLDADSAVAAWRVQERDFLANLRFVEKRAIVPLKWAVLAVSVIFWLASHQPGWLPPVPVFALFTAYAAFAAGETYLLWISRVDLKQTRPVCLVSFAVDVLFVTVLVYFDGVRYPASDRVATDFYVLYFLLILRSVALFRTAKGYLVANLGVVAMYAVTLSWQETLTDSPAARNNLIRAVFIGLVMSMVWFIVGIITRQKEELARVREDLVRSENMAGLGELAAGVAHEINNPLGIVMLNAEMMDAEMARDDPRRADVATMLAEARRCAAVVAGLLDFARPAAAGRVATDVARLAGDVTAFAARRVAGIATVRVTRDLPAGLPAVWVDPDQLKQAVMAVATNAFEALAERGGEVKVSARADTDGDVVRLSVADDGAGIAPDDLKRVFDPFFARKAGGRGLGLAVARRIVEAQGGRLEIASEPGRGTTVEFILPREAGTTE